MDVRVLKSLSGLAGSTRLEGLVGLTGLAGQASTDVHASIAGTSNLWAANSILASHGGDNF